MKHLGWVLILSIFLGFLIGCDQKHETHGSAERSMKNIELNSLEDSVAYFLGMRMANQFAYYNHADFRPESVERGLRDMAESNKFILTNDEKKEVMTDYFRWAKGYYADSIFRRSEAFLAKNLKRPEVNETPRGVQYEVIKKGEGTRSPDGNDIAKAHYKQGTALKGILIDPAVQGLENDTSLIQLNVLYSGLSEAFQRMTPGDKWKVWIHPKVGSREGEDILKVVKPNEVLYAEIELYDIIPRSHELLGQEVIQHPGYFLDETKRYE